MKPQTAAFLGKAREPLDQANTMMGVGLNEAAGRTTYLAALHAAQALICENIDKVISSHKGVQSEFWMLTKDEPRVHNELRAFLSRAYGFKRIADYETRPPSQVRRQSEALPLPCPYAKNRSV
jgi:uncharacterized protein (UPF0332 family)